MHPPSIHFVFLGFVSLVPAIAPALGTSCARARVVSGDRCEQLVVVFELRGCAGERPEVRGTVQCKQQRAHVSARTARGEYAVDVEPFASAWGRSDWNVGPVVARAVPARRAAPAAPAPIISGDCAGARIVAGTGCEDLKVEFDLHACAGEPASVSAVVACAATGAIATGNSERVDYGVRLEPLPGVFGAPVWRPGRVFAHARRPAATPQVVRRLAKPSAG